MFASGYLDATTQALWAASAPECGWRNVRFVECPVPCQDAINTSTKETLILSSVALYLQSLVMLGKAPHQWSHEDIARFNRQVMPRLCDIPEIGGTPGPVAIHRIRPDHLIPPVRALCKAGLVGLASIAVITRASSVASRATAGRNLASQAHRRRVVFQKS